MPDDRQTNMERVAALESEMRGIGRAVAELNNTVSKLSSRISEINKPQWSVVVSVVSVVLVVVGMIGGALGFIFNTNQGHIRDRQDAVIARVTKIEGAALDEAYARGRLDQAHSHLQLQQDAAANERKQLFDRLTDVEKDVVASNERGRALLDRTEILENGTLTRSRDLQSRHDTIEECLQLLRELLAHIRRQQPGG